MCKCARLEGRAWRAGSPLHGVGVGGVLLQCGAKGARGDGGFVVRLRRAAYRLGDRAGIVRRLRVGQAALGFRCNLEEFQGAGDVAVG